MPGPSATRSTALTILFTAGVVALPALARAIDPVTGLTVTRNGNDLVLSWSPSPPPVDGYRVYHASDLACQNVDLAYQGTSTIFTIPGAFLDFSPALYGVAAYAGTDEGPRSGPAYKYPVTIPAAVAGTSGGKLVSLPYYPGVVNSKALCRDLNGDVPMPDKVSMAARFMTEVGAYRTQSCNAATTALRPVYNLVSGEALLLKTYSGVDPSPVLIWGTGATPGTYTLATPWMPPSVPEGCGIGLHFVALPYDHAYADLAEIASELPAAVRVQLHDPTYDGSSGVCLDQYTGLARASAGDPWGGTNVALPSGGGEGIVLAFETVPAEWTPRRQCTAFGGGSGPNGNLPPIADAGGPYDSTLCHGGVIGIWLDGSDSFDADNSGPLTYQWSSTCAGSIGDPTSAITSALFDCNPCTSLACEVSLTVTDALGAADTDVEPVFSRQVIMCMQAGNSLRMTRAPSGVTLDWSLAPPAQNFIALKDDEVALGSPARMTCGPARQFDGEAGTGNLELFTVDGLNEPCAPR